MASLSWLIIMNTRDELFFKALGARIARARKAHGLTQKQLAHTMGIAQQTLAHYEVGRARLPASMLPILTRLLTVSLEELIDLPAPRPAHPHSGKHRLLPRIEQQIEGLADLPHLEQEFVSQMLETLLSEVSSTQARR